MNSKYISNLQKFISENRLNRFNNGATLVIEKSNVVYQYTNRKGYYEEINSIAKVQISTATFEYGNIEIIGDDFDSFQVHTGLTPNLNECTYNKDDYSLVITGSSEGINSIKGKFKVIIFA